MPVMHFYGPGLPKAKKGERVRNFSEAASRAAGTLVEKTIVYLPEMNPEEIGVGGDLQANRK